MTYHFFAFSFFSSIVTNLQCGMRDLNTKCYGHTNQELVKLQDLLITFIGLYFIVLHLVYSWNTYVDTQFCTHNLTLRDDQNNHSKHSKIMIAFHSLSHSSHIIKMILRF